jgi:hypothetical protein
MRTVGPIMSLIQAKKKGTKLDRNEQAQDEGGIHFCCLCVYFCFHEGQQMEGILTKFSSTQSLFMKRSVIAFLSLMAAIWLDGILAEPCPAGYALEGSYYSCSYLKSSFKINDHAISSRAYRIPVSDFQKKLYSISTSQYLFPSFGHLNERFR